MEKKEEEEKKEKAHGPRCQGRTREGWEGEGERKGLVLARLRCACRPYMLNLIKVVLSNSR